MKLFYKFILLIFILNFNSLFGQKIPGYSFEKYKVEVVKHFKKAKINFSSNSTAREYKTLISEGYKDGKIDFAGHYITILWGCGSNHCLSGAMVDVLTGNIYDLPFEFLETETYFCSCTLKNEQDCSSYNSTSRLFVTCICTHDGNYETGSEDKKELFIKIWDEKNKKFTLVDRVKN